VEVVASLSQGRTAAAQCGLFTHKSVPVIFEPPCIKTNVVNRTRHRQKANNSLLVSELTHSWWVNSRHSEQCGKLVWIWQRPLDVTKGGKCLGNL